MEQNIDWLVALFEPAGHTVVNVPLVEPTEFEGLPAPTKTACWKCGGEGRIAQYKHRANGVCYACNGIGYTLNGAKA